MIYRFIVGLFLMIATSACAGDALTAQESQAALATACSPIGEYVVLSTLVPYADAAAACNAIDADLVEFESTAEIQAVYDAWVQAQYVDMRIPPSEGLWVGTWIVNVEGTEWGYAMLRGGALVPVEQDGVRVALPACERR